MVKRPASVTVFGWLLIVGGVYVIITKFSSLPELKKVVNHSPLYIFYLIYSYVKITFALVSGIAILKRQNWGRFLYLIVWIIDAVIYFMNPRPMIPGEIGGIILTVITIFFLFRPKANDYFAGRDFTNVTV
jgi:hypothetical protein